MAYALLFQPLDSAQRWSAHEAESVEPAQQRTPVRVVVVDDSDDIRHVLKLALERQGDFTVVAEATDGRDAVTVVGEHQPHVVLLDISMPVMDGLQALPLIKRESPGSIVIMLTGISEA